MKLYLNYNPQERSTKVNHLQPLALIGSCFSETITDRLLIAGFSTLKNPTGILFNPLSIFETLLAIANQSAPDTSLFITRNNLWYALNCHSQVVASSADELSSVISQKHQEAHQVLCKSNLLYITLGTAWHYTHKQLNYTVANCHKLPASQFTKSMSSVTQIVEMGQLAINTLQNTYPNLQLVFTVSPVRHLRDGLEENFLSKSTLRCAIEELCNAHANASYFPAYELINDDLKDYRFYEADLAHPNSQAVEYVWEKFGNAYFSKQTAELARLFEKKHTTLQHKANITSGPEAENLKRFIDQLDSKIAALLEKTKISSK